MWNTYYSNRKCNEIEKIKDHKRHLERIITVKPMLDVKEPMKPRFLTLNAKKEAVDYEKKKKIYYENRVLLGKIIEIEKKPSPYNHTLLKPSRCPAYDKTTYQIKKKTTDIDRENLKLYNRLVSARPYYKTNEVIKDYVQSRYLESMISNTKNNVNPSLMFETPENFKKKLNMLINSNQEDNCIDNFNEESRHRSFSTTNQQRVPSASIYSCNKSYVKKPTSAVSKASTNTHYMSQMKGLED